MCVSRTRIAQAHTFKNQYTRAQIRLFSVNRKRSRLSYTHTQYTYEYNRKKIHEFRIHRFQLPFVSCIYSNRSHWAILKPKFDSMYWYRFVVSGHKRKEIKKTIACIFVSLCIYQKYVLMHFENDMERDRHRLVCMFIQEFRQHFQLLSLLLFVLNECVAKPLFIYNARHHIVFRSGFAEFFFLESEIGFLICCAQKLNA